VLPLELKKGTAKIPVEERAHLESTVLSMKASPILKEFDEL
jgi:hypothetical protein